MRRKALKTKPGTECPPLHPNFSTSIFSKGHTPVKAEAKRRRREEVKLQNTSYKIQTNHKPQITNQN
jgi:hypothetical protein